MHVVSALLRRTLLQYRPVAIEGIGTLHTARSSARFQPGQRLDPPRRMPELVATEAGDLPLSSIVAAELSLDPATAEGLCREWQQTAGLLAMQSGLPEGSLVLEGIGTLQADPETGFDFFADPDLLAMLNPLPAEPLVVPSARRSAAPMSAQHRPRPKQKNPHNYTVSILAVVIVVAAIGYLCYYLWAHTDLLSDIFPR